MTVRHLSGVMDMMDFFRKILSDKLLWFSLVVIILFGGVFYLLLGKSLETEVTEQILNRKRVIARAEVSNMSFFFDRFGDGIATLAQLSSIEEEDGSALKDLDTYVEQRRDENFLIGVILTDKDGVVKLDSNILGTRSVGESVANQDYFTWAKEKGEEGEYFISEPKVSRLGANEDQTIVVVASPVYKDEAFIGMVAASIKIQPLVERFIGMMKVLDQTKVYLVSGNGVLLYSRFESDKIGSSLSNVFSEDQIMRERIIKAQEEDQGGQFITDKHLVAYSVAKLTNQKWFVVIATPLSEITNLSRTSLVRQTAIFIFTTFIIFALINFILRKNRI